MKLILILSCCILSSLAGIGEFFLVFLLSKSLWYSLFAGTFMSSIIGMGYYATLKVIESLGGGQ